LKICGKNHGLSRTVKSPGILEFFDTAGFVTGKRHLACKNLWHLSIGTSKGSKIRGNWKTQVHLENGLY